MHLIIIPEDVDIKVKIQMILMSSSLQKEQDCVYAVEGIRSMDVLGRI